MNHTEAKEILKKYLNAWLKQDLRLFKKLLDEDIVIRECYGPIYKGIDANIKWFTEWNKIGKVLQWTIKDFAYDQANGKICFEWDFNCLYEKNEAGFSGSSFMVLKNGKFISINEYKMDSKVYYPYN